MSEECATTEINGGTPAVSHLVFATASTALTSQASLATAKQVTAGSSGTWSVAIGDAALLVGYVFAMPRPEIVWAANIIDPTALARARALKVLESWREPHETDDQAAAFRQLKKGLNESRLGQRSFFPD